MKIFERNFYLKANVKILLNRMQYPHAFYGETLMTFQAGGRLLMAPWG